MTSTIPIKDPWRAKARQAPASSSAICIEHRHPDPHPASGDGKYCDNAFRGASEFARALRREGIEYGLQRWTLIQTSTKKKDHVGRALSSEGTFRTFPPRRPTRRGRGWTYVAGVPLRRGDVACGPNGHRPG